MSEAENGKEQVDPQLKAYNDEVSKLAEEFKNIASQLRDDMKVRQLPDGVKGSKVYGPQAAQRQTFNSAASVATKISGIVSKLEKGKKSKAKGNLVGFAAPSYIHPDMAVALGLREGSILWPAGGKPIFSSALITKFFTNKVMKEGLVNRDKPSEFACNDVMRRLFTPFTHVTNKDGTTEVLDLDKLTYTKIQKIIKNFVEPRNAKTNPGPTKTPELEATLRKLDVQFKSLKEIKEGVQEAYKKEKKAETYLVKAKECLDAGQISQDLFNGYAQAYKEVVQKREAIFAQFVQQATAAGI